MVVADEAHVAMLSPGARTTLSVKVFLFLNILGCFENIAMKKDIFLN